MSQIYYKKVVAFFGLMWYNIGIKRGKITNIKNTQTRKIQMSKNINMSHNVCYGKKFRGLIREFFDSYYRYENKDVRFGLLRMFRRCLASVYGLDCIWAPCTMGGRLFLCLVLESTDGQIIFGHVKAEFDGGKTFVDYSGLKDEIKK